jgi:hypothetical protein
LTSVKFLSVIFFLGGKEFRDCGENAITATKKTGKIFCEKCPNEISLTSCKEIESCRNDPKCF